MWRSRSRRIAVVLGVLIPGLLWTACTTTITPPSAPQKPTTVCIVDYGRHASLVLPKDGGALEFEYGEWKWFALGASQSPRIIPTLFWPTQGTLGCRYLDYIPDRQQLLAERLAEGVLCFQVSSNDVAKLRDRLIERYNASLHTERVNPLYDMRFVKDPASYSAFHNCNHQLAKWLEELQCRIRGSAMFARFRLAEQSNGITESAE